MRKLIDILPGDIICDNPKCHFSCTPARWGISELKKFVNVKCPVCGTTLLTPEDFKRSVAIMRTVNFLNFLFSWMVLFYSEKRIANRKIVRFLTHNEIAIINPDSHAR